MNTKLESLPTEQLMHLLSQERKKFLLALDFGATGSDLEEIRDHVRKLESIIRSRETSSNSASSNSGSKSGNRSSVA